MPPDFASPANAHCAESLRKRQERSSEIELRSMRNLSAVFEVKPLEVPGASDTEAEKSRRYTVILSMIKAF